jgi:hypothetical protein
MRLRYLLGLALAVMVALSMSGCRMFEESLRLNP